MVSLYPRASAYFQKYLTLTLPYTSNFDLRHLNGHKVSSVLVWFHWVLTKNKSFLFKSEPFKSEELKGEIKKRNLKRQWTGRDISADSITVTK